MSFRSYGLATAIALSSWIGAAASAQSPVVSAFGFPQQSLGDSLRAIGKQSSTNILFDPSKVEVLKAPAIEVNGTFGEALAQLLKASGLTYRFLNEHTVVLSDGLNLSQSSLSSREGTRKTDDKAILQLAQTEKTDAPEYTENTNNSSSLSSKEDGKAKIEEIVVTATKRAENVQDVPQSISVITREEIERRGVVGMADYLRSVPGVTQIEYGMAGNAIIMRGIATETANPSYFSGVTTANYFGETSTTGSAGQFVGDADIRPVDLERIEVLRGPQGTTFGSSALGGAVRLIPARPELEAFSARATALLSATGGYGSENSMLQGVVNVPLVKDKFAVRLVAYDYDQSGFYKNIGIADPTLRTMFENCVAAVTCPSGIDSNYENLVRNNVPDEGAGRVRSTGGRFAALWEPTDNFDVSVNFLTQTQEQDGKTADLIAPYVSANLPINPAVRVRGQLGEAYTTKLDLLNVVANYDLGWATVTSIGSWVEGGTARAFDFGLAFGVPVSAFSKREDAEIVSGELRLASDFAGPFQFLGGLYYEDGEFNFVSDTDWAGSPATSPFTGVAYAQSRDYNPTQQAVFGEASYEVVDNLTLTAGGRFFDYETSQARLAEGAVVGIPEGVPTDETVQEDGSTYMARLGYELGADSLLYLSWAEGFRMARPQAGLPPTCDFNNDGFVDSNPGLSLASTQQTDSDTVQSYELGGKFGLFESRVRVDVALYHVDWKNMPVTAFAACTGAPAGEPYTLNAGSVTSEGVELQASLSLTEGLRFDFGLGYNDARIAEDIPSQGWVSGMPTPGSPEWNASLAAQYDFHAKGIPAFVRADILYVGEFFGDVAESPEFRAGDYVTADARAGVKLNNLSLEVFVRNLTDEDALTAGGPPAPDGNGGYRLRPRTVGIQIGYMF